MLQPSGTMPRQIDSTPVDQLTELVLELLDAHADTVELAGRLATDADWAPHLDYLRDLQRVAREVLATAATTGGDTGLQELLSRRAAA